MSDHPTSFSGLFPRQQEAEPVREPMAWKWHQAPIKTSWGHDMVVADLAIDKDNTVSVYCERDQTAKVEAMFNPPAQPAPVQEPVATVKESLQVERLLNDMLDTLPYNSPDYWIGRIKEVLALYTTPPAQTAPVQVSPLEFVTMVMEKEHLVGKPLFWAEWPNKENT